MHFFRPWLDRNYDKKVFTLKVSYIIEPLDRSDRNKVDLKVPRLFFRWQRKKVDMLAVRPNKEPIRLVLDTKKHKFRVDDGISRLIYCRKNKIKKIKAEIRVAEF